MSNFLENLRLRNLFDPSAMGQNPMQQPYDNISFGPTNVPMPSPDMGRADNFDPAQRMRELYTPESAATDKFNQMIAAQPHYQEPSGMRRIGGAILGSLTDLGVNLGHNRAGVRGTDVYDEVSGRHKYDEDVEAWKLGLTPAQAAANLERANNTNERTLAYQTVNQELTSRRDDARNKNNDEQNEIRKHRADVYDFKAHNPNLKLVVGKGGTVKAFNPITGDVKDTGIPTGTLSDADKMDMIQEDELERIQTRGAETRKTEGVKHTNRTSEITQKGDESRKTKSTPSGNSTSSKGETPTQTKVRQYNAAREFAAKNPDLAKFVKLGKNNDFTISAPSSGGFFSSTGPTKEQHDRITAGIYGSDIPVPQPSRTGAGVSTPTTAKKGVRVQSPTGQTGTYNGTKEEAIAKGYKVIG